MSILMIVGIVLAGVGATGMAVGIVIPRQWHWLLPGIIAYGCALAAIALHHALDGNEGAAFGSLAIGLVTAGVFLWIERRVRRDRITRGIPEDDELD